MTLRQNIKDIVTEIDMKYKKNESKYSKEIKLLKSYISKSSIYDGKKKKLYKLINSMKRY